MNSILLIFLFQAFATTASLLFIYFLLIAPWLSSKPISVTYAALLLPNLWRHIGLACLSTQTVTPQFAKHVGPAVAVGDLVCLVLAYLGLFAIWRRSRIALLFCSLFVIAGFYHDVVVVRAMLAVRFSAVENIGSHWYVATFVVPVMVLTEILMLFLLLRYGRHLWDEFGKPGGLR